MKLAFTAPRTHARHVVSAIWRRYLDEELGTYAAGVALFAITAIPPSVLAIAAVYGLVASPTDAWEHVSWMERWLPRDVADFFHGVMTHTASTASDDLTLAVVVTVGLAVLAAHNAVAVVMGALDKVGRVTDQRSFFRRHATALLLALAGLGLAFVMLAGLVAFPWIAGRLRWSSSALDLFLWLRWPLAFVAIAGFLALIYRVGPCANCVDRKHAIIGGLIAATIWILASIGVAYYAGNISDYESLYGTAGALLVLLLWSYVAGWAVLLGGLVAIELQRAPAA
jgi:membrane protein